LFGIRESSEAFDTIGYAELDERRLALLGRQILSELGLESALPVQKTDEGIMEKKFGLKFPSTREMAAFARSQIETDPTKADETLVRWLGREEELFLALEKLIIRERLNTGFAEVEDFIEFSLSVHQRRKSRMGFALQNHLAELFDHKKLRYTAQAHTEGKRRPDFIFPGQEEYHDTAYDPSLLVMLGAKATCKDRWRQVLVEAARIPNKHLCTLEAGISTNQTNEMKEARVTLVVPESLHTTYTKAQLTHVLSLSDFIAFVQKKQG
jgi:hypothetical protein